VTYISKVFISSDDLPACIAREFTTICTSHIVTLRSGISIVSAYEEKLTPCSFINAVCVYGQS
jgi:hypothetical protein